MTLGTQGRNKYPADKTAGSRHDDQVLFVSMKTLPSTVSVSFDSSTLSEATKSDFLSDLCPGRQVCWRSAPR